MLQGWRAAPLDSRCSPMKCQPPHPSAGTGSAAVATWSEAAAEEVRKAFFDRFGASDSPAPAKATAAPAAPIGTAVSPRIFSDGVGAGAAGRQGCRWETQEHLQEAEQFEAEAGAEESGRGSKPLQWQMRLQSAMSAAIETRAGEPLALISHLLRHAPPSSEHSAAEYVAQHRQLQALHVVVFTAYER